MKKPVGVIIISIVYLTIALGWGVSSFVRFSKFGHFDSLSSFWFLILPVVLAYSTFQLKRIARLVNLVFAVLIFSVFTIFLSNDTLSKHLTLDFVLRREGLMLLLEFVFPVALLVYLNLPEIKELFNK